MRPLLRNVMFASLCAVGLCLALAACGGSSHSVKVTGSGQRKQLVSMLEADSMLYSVPGTVFADAKALGIQVVRFNAIWGGYVRSDKSSTKPANFDASDPGSSGYNWANLDNIVVAAHDAGIKLDLTLTAPAPKWANGAGTPANVTQDQWKVSAADFAQYVTAIGKRYSGHYTPKGSSTPLPRVSFWSIWNEPNYVPNIAPQAEDATIDGQKVVVDLAASEYRKLLNAGWKALNATGHTAQSDTILIGETAPAGISDPTVGDKMTPAQQFVRDLYCVTDTYQPLTGAAATAEDCPSNGSGTAFAGENPALFKASGWADHPYAYTISPAEKLPGGDDPASKDWADFARLPALAQTLDKAAGAWGEDPKFLLYSTEYGYFASPPTPTSATGAEPAATAARWLNEAEYLSWKNPRIASYNQYLLEDPSPSVSKFLSGIETDTGAPVPDVYAAFRLPIWLSRTTASKGATLPVWGCARPLADDSTLSHTVDVQFAAGDGAFHTVKQVTLTPATGGCYFSTSVSFPSSGRVRLSYKDGATTITSRTQAVTIR